MGLGVKGLPDALLARQGLQLCSGGTEAILVRPIFLQRLG